MRRRREVYPYVGRERDFEEMHPLLVSVYPYGCRVWSGISEQAALRDWGIWGCWVDSAFQRLWSLGFSLPGGSAPVSCCR